MQKGDAKFACEREKHTVKRFCLPLPLSFLLKSNDVALPEISAFRNAQGASVLPSIISHTIHLDVILER